MKHGMIFLDYIFTIRPEALSSKLRAFAWHFVTKVTVITAIMFLSSCDDLLDIPPPDTQIVRESVFENADTALAALSGVYNKLINSPGFSGGSVSITVTEGVYADELISYATSDQPVFSYYFNSLVPTSPIVSSLWSSCYNMLYSANAVVEGVSASAGVSSNTKKQLIGEALFLRAFIHFYLVNIFGDVPYIATTNFVTNVKVNRLPVAEVYKKIINDLILAKDQLNSDYPAVNRVRVNKNVATALLARVYLFNEEWQNAEAQATELINNTSTYELLPELGEVFLKESKEVIWQLIPPYGYTNEGARFILSAPPTFVALRNSVITAFEPGDLRRKNWTDSIMSVSGLSKWFFSSKYKIKNLNSDQEYSVVMRIAEQYLIRAEARAMQDNLAGMNSAQSDINSIRSRAGLGSTPASTQQDLLMAIEKERRVELLTEYGHRFFDLKRWGKLDATLESIKPNWKSKNALLPIPQSEILANPRLIQNSGY